MKKELLDKEVIVAYDIRQVQRFLFSGTTIYDHVGANDIIGKFFSEAFRYCVKHPSVNLKDDEYNFNEDLNAEITYFNNKRIKAQVISTGGGNAFMLYRTGRIAEKINRLFSSYLLHHSYSLEVAIAAVEKTNDMEDDNNRLYIELDKAKNSGAIPFPLASIGVCAVEDATGFPAAYRCRLPFLNYSTVSHIKRAKTFDNIENSKSLQNIFELDSNPYNSLLNYDLVRENSPICAYAHMDGNSFGMTIAKIKQGVKDYKTGIRLSRQIQLNIQSQINKTLTDAKKWLAKILVKNHEKNPNVDAHVAFILIGGDDINFICNYHYALSLVEYIANSLSNKFMWKDKRVGAIPFSVCSGVAFCSKRTNDFTGISLAEKCCDIAKKEAKKPENLINGRVGNWIYFQDCKYSQNFDFKEIIKYDYLVGNKRSLCLRPYCFDKEYLGDFRHFSTFKKYYHILENLHLSQYTLNYISASFARTKFVVDSCVEQLKKNIKNFPKDLMTTFVKVPNRENECALWFDALEIEGYYYDVFKEE